MHELRPNNYLSSSVAITPKDNSAHYSNSYIQYSPAVKNKSKSSKEPVGMERPKSNKSRQQNNHETPTGSQKQMDSFTGSMQKLLLDRNNNNLYGSFYNTGAKPREREKNSGVTTFKLKAPLNNLLMEQRESPAKRPVKYVPLHYSARLDEDKLMDEYSAAKSYRKDHSELRVNDATIHRPGSRQTNNSHLEINRSHLNPSSMSSRNMADSTPELYKSKSTLNLADMYANVHIDPKSKKYKIADEHERIVNASALNYSRSKIPESPAGSQRNYEYLPYDGNKGYKSAYRGAEGESQHGLSVERKESTASRKQHRRGLSIDQVIHYGVEKTPSATSRRELKDSKTPRADEHMQVSQERRITGSRQEHLQQQLKQQQIEKQMQAQLQLQQQQLQLQQQQLQQQQLQQQMLQQQQQQQQQQEQVIVINNEADQIKYFEKLLHIDKVSFDFEKQMVARRNKKQTNQGTHSSTAATTKQSGHTRTRSVEDPSLIQTKSGDDGHEQS